MALNPLTRTHATGSTETLRNPFTIVTNDARAKKVGKNRLEMAEDSGGGDSEDKWVVDELGLVTVQGRGETDTSITYYGAFNTNGTLVYFYPNAAGNALIVTTVKP